jgi:dipeptidyl aminopeptidase/acylaminoacyl peptidase
MVETARFGTWRSPITAELVARANTSVSESLIDDRAVWWLEHRPHEAGRTVVVRADAWASPVDVTPPGFDVRTLVHEYGGGAYTVADGVAYFSNFSDQRLYRHSLGDEPRAITPEPPEPRSLRYADMDVSPDGRRIACVRETHHGDELPRNEIVLMAADGTGDVVVVDRESDFVASPRWSSDGARLAWIRWRMPWMPWDETELVVATVEGGRVGAPERVAGGERESVMQPAWSPADVLHLLSDRTGWWNLYRADGDGSVTNVTPRDAEFGVPMWEFAYSSYAFLEDGRIACAYREAGIHHLAIVDPVTMELIDVDLPYTVFDPPYVRASGSRLSLVAASATSGNEVVLLDLIARSVDVLRPADDLGVPPGLVSTAEPIEYPTRRGETAFAYFYPPTNPAFVGPQDERPPLVVHAHGGPTSEATPDLHPYVQYFTSRGFAFVDVNYGGSTGYGRPFRERLYGMWGVVDVEDCIAAARFLADRGSVDGDRCVVTGGSAGGYIVLASLAFHPEAFAGGTSYFGVADLEPFATFTHKFELKYTDLLVGPWPDAADRWRERSPVHRADAIERPVLLLQGLEDAVVPPAQAETMVAALERKGVPYAYVAFEGEQHGFRRAESIIASYQAELGFYGRILGFDPADELPPLEIRHLED